MRTVWKGTIGLGGFAIPVKAYSATGEHGNGLAQVHTTDGGRIRLKRFCDVEDTEVPSDEVGKGYETAGGDVVVLSDEELASLPLPTAHSMQILGFVPPSRIDPLYFAKSYFLEPEITAHKPYAVLTEALQQADRVALVKVAMRSRESLGALSVRDQVIMLDTMRWPSEIRTPDFPFLHEDIDVRVSEVRAAAGMIEELSTDFTPESYSDSYGDALAELIQAKLENREVKRPTEAVQDEGVAALLQALQEGTQAVQRAKEAAETAVTAAEEARKAAEKAKSAARNDR